jgi:hypothetical protein
MTYVLLGLAIGWCLGWLVAEIMIDLDKRRRR